MRLPDEAPDGPSRMQAYAFADVQRFFAAHDIPVPEIYAEDIAHGLMLVEDLGDETFELALGRVACEQHIRLHALAVQPRARGRLPHGRGELDGTALAQPAERLDAAAAARVRAAGGASPARHTHPSAPSAHAAPAAAHA